MNGLDVIRIHPDLHGEPEEYEPEMWKTIVDSVRAGDIIADVGAHVGIYSIVLALRSGPTGTVYAFEPDPVSRSHLEQHLRLNGVQDRVAVVPCPVGDEVGDVVFETGQGTQSHVEPTNADAAPPGWACGAEGAGAVPLQTVTLDSVFERSRVDVLKIDVEGFEAHVLRGARALLSDANRRPRTVFVEAHPYAWCSYGTTERVIVDTLVECGYSVSTIDHIGSLRAADPWPYYLVATP